MSEEREQEEQSSRVKVVDRRRYALDEQGDVVTRPDAQPREPEPEPAPMPPPAPAAGSGAGIAAGPAAQAAAPTAPTAPAAPPPDAATPPAGKAPALSAEEQAYAQQVFLEFLNGLAHSMLAQLGEVPDPGSGLVREDLEGARQTLEMLSVLRHKTEGNLTAQEARMFDGLLYELMMRFRQRVEGVAGGAGRGGQPGGIAGGRP
jgi:hypothetical protein